MEKKLIQIIKNLGIQELEGLETLNLLDGNYLNLECILPNGKTGKILDDTKTYYACQVHMEETDKCYGVAADDTMLAVYRYGCNGTDAELVIWKKITIKNRIKGSHYEFGLDDIR